MTHQVPWNKVILEEFIRIGCLSKTEEMIMRTRVHGWTITKQSYEFNMSESNIKKIIARLKKKYDNAEKYSAILPPRKQSEKNCTWMRTEKQKCFSFLLCRNFYYTFSVLLIINLDILYR